MEAILFIGIPASGKSTFYRLGSLFETHLRLNLDMLRTRHRESLLLEACLAAKQPLVIDNTNVTRRQRAPYIERCRAAGFRVVGYYFQSRIGDCLTRNAQREGRGLVPERGVRALHAELELPSRDEGFDELRYVVVAGDGRFSIEEYDDGLR